MRYQFIGITLSKPHLVCTFYNKQINAKKYEWKFGSVQILRARQCILLAIIDDQYYRYYTRKLMQFQQISRDDLNRRLRDDSAIYKVIPAFRNKNQVNAKAIYLTEEKKTRPTSRVDFVPKLSCGTICPKEMGKPEWDEHIESRPGNL